jgi:O-antigen ligase
MNEQNQSNNEAAESWRALAIVSGAFILFVSLIHVPGTCDALNYFDPIKRLSWGLLAVILACVWTVRSNRFTRAPLWLSFGVLAWMIVRTILKPQPDVELEVLFTWVLPLLLFILATSMDQIRGLRIIGWFLILAGVIQAVLMVLQRFGFDPFFLDTTAAMDYKPGRMIGTIGYQNQAVDFLALSGVGVFLVCRSVGLRLVYMIAMLFVSGLAGNRGGVAALTVAIMISQILWVRNHGTWSTQKKRVIAVVVLVGVCVTLGAVSLISETGSRFREIFSDAQHSPAVGSRMYMARVGMEMYKEKPWIGWGGGEYAAQYLDRLGTVLPDRKTHEILRSVVFAREAHNDYLQFTVEFGIIGLLALITLLGIGVARVIRAGSFSPETSSAMAYCLAYMAVSSLFSFPWQTSMAGPLAGLLIGWLWPRGSEREAEFTELSPGMLPIILGRAAKTVLVILTLILVWWFARDVLLNGQVPLKFDLDGPAGVEHMLPNNAYRYHALVGASYAWQGDDVEAERELNLAQRGYRDVPLWNNLGHVYAKRHKWPEATAVYEQWARCGLDHSNALINLSIAYEQTGRLKESADTLARKLDLWWDASLAEIKRLAVLQLKARDARGAQNTLNLYRSKWTGADIKTVAEFENLDGSIWLVLMNKQEALKLFRAALEKCPELQSAKRNLAGLSDDTAK